MILKNFTSPSGAALGYHSVVRIEGNLNDPYGMLTLTVHSWPSEEAYVTADGRMPVHASYPCIPQSALNGAQLLLSCEQALVQATPEVSEFSGGSIIPAVTGLELARVRQWAKIKQTRAVLDAQPIAVEGFSLEADERSRMDIMGAIMAMQLVGQTERLWRCSDNVMRTLTFAQITAAGTAIAARRQQLIEVSDGLYQQIFSPTLTTVEQVEAIVWPVG